MEPVLACFNMFLLHSLILYCCPSPLPYVFHVSRKAVSQKSVAAVWTKIDYRPVQLYRIMPYGNACSALRRLIASFDFPVIELSTSTAPD